MSWAVVIIDLPRWMCRAVCYDETVYPAPHTYDPERFLKDGKLDRSVKDPEDRIFGSGRRYDPAPCHPSLTLHANDFLCGWQDMSRKVARSPELVSQHFFHTRSVRSRGPSRREARTQVPRNSHPVRHPFFFWRTRQRRVFGEGY